MNLPNILTFLRILMIPIIIYIMDSDFPNSNHIACILFIIASISDYFDGYLARKYNLVTNLGKILDPLADKLLILSILICLTTTRIIPIWIVLIILTRELAMTSLRAIAADSGIIISANILGKIKTVVQMISIIFILFNLSGGIILIYLAVIFTIISFVSYLAELNKKINWI